MGPMNEFFYWFSIEPKLGLGDIGDEFGAGLARRIEKLLPRSIGAKVSFIFRRQKRRLMMIEPPRQFFGGRILEIDDGVLIAIEHVSVEEYVTGPMQETAVRYFSRGMNSLLVEACESCRRGHAVKAMTVIGREVSFSIQEKAGHLSNCGLRLASAHHFHENHNRQYPKHQNVKDHVDRRCCYEGLPSLACPN